VSQHVSDNGNDRLTLLTTRNVYRFVCLIVFVFIISCIHAHTEVHFIVACNMTSYLTLPHVTGVLSTITETFSRGPMCITDLTPRLMRPVCLF